MTSSEQALINRLDASLNATPLTVDVSSFVPIEFRPEDLANVPPNRDEQAALAAKINAKRDGFCKVRPWWQCNQETTSGVCTLVQGECKGVPVGEVGQKTHYQVWRDLYAGIYGPMPEPNVTVDGTLILPEAKPRFRGRRGSLRRPLTRV